jgi:hypothetical protein
MSDRPAKKPSRRAGDRWRILVHQILPGGKYGDSHHVASDKTLGGGDGRDYSVEADGQTFWSRHVEIPGTEFDELVIGRWIHLEQMDAGRWWMNVGGVTLWVHADRNGRPKSVSVYGPQDYATPEPGCEYHLTWSDPPDRNELRQGAVKA